ncbi:MAG TPA: hypothetical protein VFQ44_20755 [Streptosporangiaceae bacterium]|nr:hypothetical protein [Streptosporangiaceae bacterium]
MTRMSVRRLLAAAAIGVIAAGLFRGNRIAGKPARLTASKDPADVAVSSGSKRVVCGSKRVVSPFVETLGPDTFRQRVGDIFPQGYLTALAIIQGVALGVLLTVTQAQWYRSAELIHHIMIATQATSVFIAIVVVTHRYILLTIMARWIPSTFDTLIPFSLGVGEIGSALSIGRPAAWWSGTLVFALAGIGAFAHSRIRASIEAFENMTQLYWRFRRITLRAIWILSLQAAISVVMFAGSFVTAWSGWAPALAPLAFLACLVWLDILGNYRMSAPITAPEHRH